MDSYMLYLAVAGITVALPGPGVVMTVSNAAQNGFSRSLPGIFGISMGGFIVAAISATGLGVLLVQSAAAFTAVKCLGALYLIYLGVKVWRSKSGLNTDSAIPQAAASEGMLEGVLLSLSNPKAIVFFMSIFPQFIDTSKDYVPQFILLSVTFSALIVIVHTFYAATAAVAKSRIMEPNNTAMMNKVSGGLLIGFGIGLAGSNN